MGKSILLFDNECKICNSSIKFVTKGDARKIIRQLPIGSAEGQKIIELYPQLLGIDSIIFISESKIFIKSDAVIEIAKKLSFPYNVIALGRFIPKIFRNALYDWIAKNRYHWFGKIKSCDI